MPPDLRVRLPENPLADQMRALAGRQGHSYEELLVHIRKAAEQGKYRLRVDAMTVDAYRRLLADNFSVQDHEGHDREGSWHYLVICW